MRIRDKDHKPLEVTFGSENAATEFVDKTTEERKRGLFIDYTAALKVSFAELMVRYLLERAWTKKSGKVTTYCLEGWLEDSGPLGAELLERYREKLRIEGREVRVPKSKMRQPSGELAWIHKRLAQGLYVVLCGTQHLPRAPAAVTHSPVLPASGKGASRPLSAGSLRNAPPVSQPLR